MDLISKGGYMLSKMKEITEHLDFILNNIATKDDVEQFKENISKQIVELNYCLDSIEYQRELKQKE